MHPQNQICRRDWSVTNSFTPLFSDIRLTPSPSSIRFNLITGNHRSRNKKNKHDNSSVSSFKFDKELFSPIGSLESIPYRRRKMEGEMVANEERLLTRAYGTELPARVA